MPHDIFDHCLSGAIARFKQQHPDILLNLFVAKGVKNLAAREADVAIRLTPQPPDYLIGKKVATLQHGIYANSGLDLGKSVPIIAWSDESAVPVWAEQYFPNASIVMRVDDLTSMYCAVKAGIGIAKMPCYLPDSLNHDEVRRMALDIAPSSWGLWVLSHADLRHSARIRRCREFLSEQLLMQKSVFEGEHSNFL
jgi:DNA-binding transcriptional LysR family regulator